MCFTYNPTSGIHLMAGVCAGAKSRVTVKSINGINQSDEVCLHADTHDVMPLGFCADEQKVETC